MPSFLRAILPDSGLGLRVQTQGDRVLLSWNRRNSVVRSASQAILHIDDGSQHRDVRLNAGETENGAVLYRPKSDDVTFQLEVRNAQGAAIAESIRVLDGAGNAPLDVSATAELPSRTASDVPAPPVEHHDWKPVAETATTFASAPRARPQSDPGRLPEPAILVANTPQKRTADLPPEMPSVMTVPRDSVGSPIAESLLAASNASKPPETANPAPVTNTASPTTPSANNAAPTNTASVNTTSPPAAVPPQKTADPSSNALNTAPQTAANQTDGPAKVLSQEPPSAVQKLPQQQTTSPTQPASGMVRTSMPSSRFRCAPTYTASTAGHHALPSNLSGQQSANRSDRKTRQGRARDRSVRSGRQKESEGGASGRRRDCGQAMVLRTS